MLSTLFFASAFADELLDEYATLLQKMDESPNLYADVKLAKYKTCPGAMALGNVHTMAQMQVTFQDSCDKVAAEVMARANHQDGWKDPHNNGHYTMLSSNGNMVATKRLTGNNKFTDKQTFSLTPQGSGCTAQICSESQGTSAADGGTNMCDMFNLFCNSGEKNGQNGVACKPIMNDLQYNIDSMQCGNYFGGVYVGHQCQDAKTTCLKNPSLAAPKLEKYNTCPGTIMGGAIHTMAQMQVNFEDSCDTVAAEIKARATGMDNWTDPHNKGKYAVQDKYTNDNLVVTTRTTANHVFTDAQSFSLQANGSGCTVYACSESQGPSANDGGTNLCDMFDLFCNSNETGSGGSCRSVNGDLTYTIVNEQCLLNIGLAETAHQCQNPQQTCLKNPSLSAPQKKISYL